MRRLIPSAGLLLLAAMAAAQNPAGLFPNLEEAAGTGPKVDARAVLDTNAVAPGKPFELAITLTTHPGWHIYWSNPGESGIATSFDLTLPEGFKADPVRYPLPHKFVLPGDVTCYGNEGATTFLVKITPPATLPQPMAPLKIKATWLNCTSEQCVPGEARLSVPLTAGTGEAANEKLFAAAREAMPAPSPPRQLFAPPGAGVVITGSAAKGFTYTCRMPFTEKVQSVEAFPEAVEGVDVSVPKVEQAEGETTISLTARVLSGQHITANHLPLVVVYTSVDGKRRGFYQQLGLEPLKSPGTK